MRKLRKLRHNLRTICASILPIAFVVATSSCLKRSHNSTPALAPAVGEQRTSVAPTAGQTNATRININTASANELETLPGIGKSLAERIIAHREKSGAFRRSEHLIIVRGISDKRFRSLRDLITVE